MIPLNITSFQDYNDLLNPDVVTFQNCMDYTKTLRDDVTILIILSIFLTLVIMYLIKERKKGLSPV